MSKNDDKIKKDLLELYDYLYPLSKVEGIGNLLSKNILNKLKYSPEEVKEALLSKEVEKKTTQKKATKKKSESVIENIKTEADVLKYYKENFNELFNSDISKEKENEILKKLTLVEINHLYKVVFGIEAPKKGKKIDVIKKVKDFFDDMDRTSALSKII